MSLLRLTVQTKTAKNQNFWIDAREAMRSELDKLIDNAEKTDRSYFENEFSSFQFLFDRFLEKRGPSIEWDKIRPPPEDMVSFLIFFI